MKILDIFELPVMAGCVNSKSMGKIPLLADNGRFNTKI
jgi:hypothetical protein